MAYAAAGVPAIVLAGREYGSGSSRDWAAKGTRLLGIRAVIAESYERIHRSNLVGMGVLPAPVPAGRERRVARADAAARRTRSPGSREGLAPRARLAVVATADPADGGGERRFAVECRLDGPIEVDYYRQGGILPAVLRRIARESGAS